jgi:hypothetical protein
MKAETWTSSCTPQFEDDVAHYQPGDARVEHWRRTIERHPFIGKALDGQQAMRGHDVDGFRLDYLVMAERRQVMLLVLTPKEHLPKAPGAFARVTDWTRKNLPILRWLFP